MGLVVGFYSSSTYSVSSSSFDVNAHRFLLHVSKKRLGEYDYNQDEMVRKHVVVENIRRIAAYIPIIGSVIGIANLVRLSQTDCLRPVNKNRLCGRAVVETLSCGWVFIIPDIVATIFRSCR